MQTINYPLLYYPLREGLLLCQLLGTGISTVGTDLEVLKKALRQQLQRQYKKKNEYPQFNMRSPRLRMADFELPLFYQEGSQTYPLSEKLKLSLPAVYGSLQNGHYICYLPTFDRSFVYYEEQQFETLLQHTGFRLLNNLSPEEVYALMRHPLPSMDVVKLRVNPERQDMGWSWRQEPELETLKRLTEPYPALKGVRRQRSSLPEAVWERELEINQLMDQIIGSGANVLVTGRSGAGKSAVLRQAIKRLKKQAPDYTFWRLLPERITDSAKYLGEWQEYCEALVEELNQANGILWVDNIVELLRIGGEGPRDSVAAFLLSFLNQGQLQMVGEASPQELENLRRLLPGFVDVFQVLPLEELSPARAGAVLQKMAAYTRQNLKINISQEALDLSYRLLLRHYPYESFPGKGVKFLGRCINEAQNLGEAAIGLPEVIRNFIAQTGLPELFLRDELPLDHEAMAAFFQSRIIGQPDALRVFAQLITVYKAELQDPEKPIASLLFTGPTGVGKTASANALADYFFGQGQQKPPLIRIDMSEFQYPWQVAQLIGDGPLIRGVRERPFSVILFDEIEKASPAVFDALLGLLDEGVLVDGYGRETYFRNTIVIMTSNLGASNRSVLGFGKGQPEAEAYRSAVERHFRPEFVNRIDDIVVFRPLSSADIRLITEKELKELKAREGFVRKGIEVSFSEELIEQLAAIGFDERYGARPLQRAIQDHVAMPVSEWMLKQPELGPCRLLLDMGADRELRFEVRPWKR